MEQTSNLMNHFRTAFNHWQAAVSMLKLAKKNRRMTGFGVKGTSNEEKRALRAVSAAQDDVRLTERNLKDAISALPSQERLQVLQVYSAELRALGLE
ncbi:hypothetical protein HQ571_02365 [Candidatus Kuenenbacteria bacterium]|nr:hypothetical protein [Candidatus Kuenenbacteria bacterium]